MITLSRFGSVTLPKHNPEPEFPALTRPTGIALPGGGFHSPYGSGRAPRDLTTIVYRCAIVEDTAAAVDTTAYTLLGLRGKRDKLWRTRSNGAAEWTYARCMSVEPQLDVTIRSWLPLTLTFEMLSPHWYGRLHGGAWTFDSGKTFDSGLYFDEPSNIVTLDASPKAITLTNGGNTVVHNAIITVTAGSANITALTIANTTTGAEMDFTGTITAGQSLVIDCGAKSVKNNGTNAYSSFSLDATNHIAEEWFPIEGSNSVSVTITGGSTDSTIKFEYSDGYE